MCEPPHGEPEMPPLPAALAALDRDIQTIVEQDLYPVEPHVPLPIGARTAGYFAGCGLGPVRRWPYRAPGVVGSTALPSNRSGVDGQANMLSEKLYREAA